MRIRHIFEDLGLSALQVADLERYLLARLVSHASHHFHEVLFKALLPDFLFLLFAELDDLPGLGVVDGQEFVPDVRHFHFRRRFLPAHGREGSQLRVAFGLFLCGALLMSADLFFQVQRDQLVALAANYRIPVMWEWPEFVEAGGLISYAPVRTDALLQSGIYVGRILNGAKPADLPIA